MKLPFKLNLYCSAYQKSDFIDVSESGPTVQIPPPAALSTTHGSAEEINNPLHSSPGMKSHQLDLRI